MHDQTAICVLHLDESGESCGNIKLFSENFDKWLKVQECLGRRRDQYGKSKYNRTMESLGRSFELHHGYHSKCYKNFTAISETQNQVQSSSVTRNCRSRKSSDRPSRTSILPPECIFCGKVRKKFKGKWIELGKSETFNAEINIRTAAKELNDQSLLRKIGTYDFGCGPDFPAMEARYHHQCKKDYLNKLRNMRNSKQNEENVGNKAKKCALKDIITKITIDVIEKKQPCTIIRASQTSKMELFLRR